ncbi:conserved protein of unknown function [Sterolibacterium denitrificans]|uniref:PilZ domain-containing protein n=1 Tax=Sterolibacterium denitrificans TaxID=157592 RepID=A0A7Z7MV40_9PROT|nr:hypothetical protein [Sterolibacterium denitrificans]SMB23954.1 conserved protein of unknown function [Sterolibacterium denitrificans]
MGWFSLKSSHPLTDSVELKRVLEALPGLEPATALDETRTWLESLVQAEDMKIEQCLDLILRLDEATLGHARRFGRDYLMAQDLGRSEEYRLWNGNHSYWAQLVAAYEYCLARHASAGKQQINPLLLLLLQARLLHAYAAGIKWAQFRHTPAVGYYWQGAGRIYLAAQAAGAERKIIPIYPNTAESSVEREYLLLLMLHSSSLSNLLPLEVEIAERLVAYLAPQLVFTDQMDPANVYWVDAARPLPPSRIVRPPEMTPSLRFLRPGTALEKIVEIRTRITKSGAVPADLQLGGQFSPQVVLPVLEHLAQNWQSQLPQRNHQRHQVRSRLHVIHGFAAIHAKLSREGAGAGADNSAEETWIAEDVSLGGMGAEVPLGAKEWIRIGALIGVQPEGGDNWLVGLIRRFSRGEGGGSVGIQTIGKAPQAVVADCGGLPTHLVLLDLPALPPAEVIASGKLLVEIITVDAVLESSSFEAGIPMTTLVTGRALRLRPQTVIEHGTDFVIARFQIDILS